MIRTSIQVWYLNHLNRPGPRVTTTVLFSTSFGPLHASSPQQQSIGTAHKGCNDVPRCIVHSVPYMWCLRPGPRAYPLSTPRTPHILLTRIPEHSQNIQHDRWVAWRLGCSISDAVRERVNSQNALNLTNTRHASYTIQMPTG